MKRNRLRDVAIMTTNDENMEDLLDTLQVNGYTVIETDSSRYNNRHFYIAKVERSEDDTD